MNLRQFFAAAILATTATSYAIVIPVGTTPADDLLINYDFSGATPAPPYDSTNTSLGFSGFDTGEIVTIDMFRGLNGTDFYFGTTFSWSSGTVNWTLSIPTGGDLGMLDGVYSFGLRLNQGAVDLGPNLLAQGFDFTPDPGSTATIQGSVVSVVPEPASLALLGIGLAGLAASRRRKLN